MQHIGIYMEEIIIQLKNLSSCPLHKTMSKLDFYQLFCILVKYAKHVS
jgi:hypothetical protein